MHAEPSCSAENAEEAGILYVKHLIKACSVSIHTILQVSHPGVTLGRCKYCHYMLVVSYILFWYSIILSFLGGSISCFVLEAGPQEDRQALNPVYHSGQTVVL